MTSATARIAVGAASAMLMAPALQGCTSLDDMSREERAQANLCEWARSREPYYPDDCTSKPPTCRNCGVLFPQGSTSRQTNP